MTASQDPEGFFTRRTLLIVLACITFVAAMSRTLPGAIREQQEVMARRVAAAEVARETADSLARAPAAALARDSLGRPSGLERSGEEAGGGGGPVQALRNLKEGFRQTLVANGLGEVWEVWLRIRTYVFDLRALLWLAFFLLLEQLFPAKPMRRLLTPNRILDALYPVFSATVRVLVVVIAYTPIRSFYENQLSFTHLRVLDDLPLVAQGIGAFLVADFAHWLSHWTRHKVRWLWYFHAVHHSQTELSPWTAWRAHPLEEAWNYALVLIPAGIFGGDKVTWIVITILYGVIWPPFTHSNIRSNLGPFRHLIVSPQYHRVHHSNDPKQYDFNFGENLILWDWLFGTMWKDRTNYPDTGIPNGEFIEERTLTPTGIVGAWVRQCVYPFMMIGRSIRDAVGRLAGRGA